MSDKLRGRYGIATPITALPETPDQTAVLAQWLLFLPHQHPLWDHYTFSSCHLRPIEGARPAELVYPGATHEILMVALDPDKKPNAADMESLHPLTPINYSHQCHGFSDEQMIQIVREMAQLFVDGSLVAEPQGIHGARELFGNLLRQVKVKVAGHA